MSPNTYIVTAPRPVLDHEPGDTFTHLFSFEEETNLLAAGRIQIVPSDYEVVGASRVHETDPGGKFKAAITLPQKAALIEGGHIEQVAAKPATDNKKAAPSATKQKES